ncbi:MAG: outer membrane beta-barrel protein [Gemmataceae bacterium]|nr:outer membrane beta-barrel protein [Gemmataceae bacterium]
MVVSFVLSAALALGQASVPAPATSFGVPGPSGPTTVTIEPAPPATTLSPSLQADLTANYTAQVAPVAADEPPPAKPVEAFLPMLPQAKPVEAAVAARAAVPDRWFLQKFLQGTGPGVALDTNRIAITGWTEMAYTASTNKVSNVPDTWNDRANRFLLQQHVIRLDRPIDTAAKEPTWGFHLDTLIGSDYRYTLPRGLFESQLLNTNGNQNLYGVDPIDFYVNAYYPGLFQGTEFAIGRFLTECSSESELTILTPLLTRSYSFQWGGPFTHTGVMVAPNLTKQWQARLYLVTGNEVFIDPSQELRFMGKLMWTSANKRDVLIYNTTLGRGKFNAGDPFAPATFATIQEPAGRNNINVFDFIWIHKFNDRFAYQAELLYGYQYGVPTTAAVGAIAGAIDNNDKLSGTADWAAFVQYYTYRWTEKFTTIARLELFDDFDGQRTGFKGLYAGATAAFQYQATKSVTVRPELRYYNNGYSRPYEGKHDIFDAAFDLIVRW